MCKEKTSDVEPTKADIEKFQHEAREAGMPEWWLKGKPFPAAADDPDFEKSGSQIQ